MSISIEETTTLALDFSKLDSVAGVIPVAIQHAETGEVLLIAYTNGEALRETLRTRQLILWSTSRGNLWHKGKESGNTFRVESVRVNCEQNSLVYQVTPQQGGICHTKNPNGAYRMSCYYRNLNLDTGELEYD